MVFFMVDDQMHMNRKARALAETALHGDLTGIAALGLWSMAGSSAQSALDDGKISVNGLVKVLLNMEAVNLLAGKLVEVNLWHAPGHSCERCPEVPELHYLFHDWKSMGYESGASIRLKRDKAKELKDPALRAAVWARDCTDYPKASIGSCRYCGTTVKRADQKGPKRPELDHVDPTKACGATNVVLACFECNRKKGQRNPAQAGMTLHPAPARAAGSVSVEPSSPLVAAGQAPETSIAHPAVEHCTEEAARFNLLLPQLFPTQHKESSATPPGIDFPIKSDPEHRSNPIIATEAIPGRTHVGAHNAHAGERTGGVGKGGVGLSSGLSPGKPAPNPTPRSKPRRRKRRSNKPNPVSNAVPSAGDAPSVPTAGRFGSPYYGVRGKQEDVPESICQLHGLHMPCRTCHDDAERNETLDA